MKTCVTCEFADTDFASRNYIECTVLCSIPWFDYPRSILIHYNSYQDTAKRCGCYIEKQPHADPEPEPYSGQGETP